MVSRPFPVSISLHPMTETPTEGFGIGTTGGNGCKGPEFASIDSPSSSQSRHFVIGADFILYRGALSKAERKDYINAVLCLQKLPSKLDPKKFPGARTRYDDFVGVHINQTLSIHFTVCFFHHISQTVILPYQRFR